jgi:two-component system nitrogen regulation response regulator GlnG
MAQSKLLVVDDDPLILKVLRFAIPAEDVELRTAMTAAEGFQSFVNNRPDAVLLDIRLPDESGLELFKRMQNIDPKVPVILMTGHSTAEVAIDAMRLGAFDYISKPMDPDALSHLIAQALAVARLMRVPAVMPGAAPTVESADLFIGRSPAMQEVFKSIGRVAPQDVTVLILGESGTGKEMVARSIYHYSKRADKPFLAINCAAIPEPLLESELFGHERGAFTGAERRRIGKFEQCHGGTLFLDEIGDMTPLTQSKVLRVLQDRQFERVGGNETIKADVRVIAATNRDLASLMAAGRFRDDLYYRLNVFTIALPPLRERIDDIPLLVQHFLANFNRELGKEVTTIDPEAMALLQSYSWPGNIRELQSVLKQSLLRASGPVLLADFLPTGLRSGTTTPSPRADDSLPDVLHFVRSALAAGKSNLHADTIATVEKILLAEVMTQSAGNISQAARILGISRPTLRAKLAELLPELSQSSQEN